MRERPSTARTRSDLTEILVEVGVLDGFRVDGLL